MQRRCHVVDDAGLSEDMRKDQRLMSTLSRHISIDPTTRVRRLLAVRQQIEAYVII